MDIWQVSAWLPEAGAFEFPHPTQRALEIRIPIRAIREFDIDGLHTPESDGASAK